MGRAVGPGGDMFIARGCQRRAFTVIYELPLILVSQRWARCVGGEGGGGGTLCDIKV